MDRVSLRWFVIQEKSISSPAAANGFLMMSFMARSSVVVVVGFLGDVIGLEATYICRAAGGAGGDTVYFDVAPVVTGKGNF